MKFGLKVAFLLVVVTATVTVKGSALSDDHNGNTVHRSKRWSGFSVFDTLRGNGPKPTKPIEGDGFGFNLADVLGPDPKPSKPAGGKGSGFNLEDALRPAPKPTDKPTGGECQANVVQKLSKVIENQTQQLRLLLQLMARSA